jgi:hypothetical protein
MKKLLILSVILIAFQINTQAQKARFGIAAGVAMSNYSFKISDVSLSGNSRLGITAGLLGDIPLGKSFSFQPAVNFVQYGTSIESESFDATQKDEIKVNCLEVPLNCVYNAEAGNGRIFVGAGPAISFHLSGKEKSFDSYYGEEEKSFVFGNDLEADMRRTNIGANFIAGYNFSNGLFISMNYNLGLKNLQPGDSEDESTKAHYFGLRVGYFFK